MHIHTPKWLPPFYDKSPRCRVGGHNLSNKRSDIIPIWNQANDVTREPTTNGQYHEREGQGKGLGKRVGVGH